MAKIIAFDEESRRALERGVNALAQFPSAYGIELLTAAVVLTDSL